MTTGERTRQIAGFHFLPFDAPRARRLPQLLLGLICFGLALAWTLVAQLGASPWTVFHKGAAELTGLTIGTIVSLTGLILLIVLWLMKEPLGLGTVCNVLVIGPVIDVTLAVMPDVDTLWVQIVLLVSAPVLLGIGSGLYLNAGVGPGPRDGIMTGLNRRGIATWKARTGVEIGALGVGMLLGAAAGIGFRVDETVGIGTIWMAVATGPCVQFFLPYFKIDP